MTARTINLPTGGTGAGAPRARPTPGLSPTRPRRDAPRVSSRRVGREGWGEGSGHRDESSEPPSSRFRVATWNVGTLKGRSSEVVERLSARCIDICGIQEHRWKGTLASNQVRYLKGKDTEFKFLWCGNAEGTGGAGFLVAKKWADQIIEVQRASDRILLIKLILGKSVFSLISIYAPQSGLSAEIKERFYDQLQGVVAKVPNSENLLIVGDWNGHAGATAEVYSTVHGSQGYGMRNAEGDRMLEFATANDLRVGNTWFKKRDSHLVTFSSGGNQTQIDYILYRRGFSRYVSNVRTFPGSEEQELVTQHRLLACDFTVARSATKKRKFTPRIRVWKLREAETAKRYQETFAAKVAAATNDADVPSTLSQVEVTWGRLKGPLLEAATEVCGTTKDHQWCDETWWWDERVKETVDEKRLRFKTFNDLKKQGLANSADGKAAHLAYQAAKRVAKKVVWQAKSDAGRKEFADVAPNGDGAFRLAKQIGRRNQDVEGESCIRNDNGELAFTDEDKMKAWHEHYARLFNIEFDWPSAELPDVAPVAGPRPDVPTALLQKCLNKAKSGKAPSPTGVVVEMLKAAGDEGVTLLKQLTDEVFSSGEIPKDWEESIILNLFKGKGAALERGNYRALKLTDQVMKLLERVLDSYIRKMVNIDDMQFGFVPGRGTTDAIFIVRQLQEKYLAVNKPLYFAFVDLEKAFDRVPRKVLWWALRSCGVEEWAVRIIQAMYSNARSRVRVNGQYSEEFGVGVGVHQGSVLSPLLFILVLEALSRTFRTGTPWELLYADDLAVIADSLDECVAKLKAWKAGMENKGLRVNMPKTKCLVSGVGLDVLKDSGKFPCAVCRSGVGSNAIQCTTCKLWVHKRCCGIKSALQRLTANQVASFVCPRCQGLARPIDGRPVTHVEVDGVQLDVVGVFCYLGDTISAAGGCDAAAAARCCVAWGKFNTLLPLLTTRYLSPKIRGKVYETSVRNSMLHGSETWAPRVEELQRLRRNDRAMIRWICRVGLRDDVSSDDLLRRLEICDITVVLQSRRLRWAGHVHRSQSAIKTTSELPLPGRRGPGRPRKTWKECVKADIVKANLSEVDPSDRDAWRAGVRRSLVLPTPLLR